MSMLESLLDKLKSGEIPASSKLDIINEKRQEIPRGVNIKRFSYEFQKNSRVLFRLQMALPFDPELGEATEDFNPEKKWRPPLSPTTAAKLIKYYAKKNIKTKDLLMRRASISEWDLSNPDELNAQDFKVLRSYRNPLVITTEAITINDAGITGLDFGINYSVPVKRDLQTGQIIGNVPEIAKMGEFMSSVTFAEIRELDEAIISNDPNKYKAQHPFINPSAISVADDRLKREWIGKILGGSIISSVRPQNYLMAFEFKLSFTRQTTNEERNPLPIFTALNDDDLKERQIWFNYTKKYKEPLMKILETPSLDYYWDFVEMDICDNLTHEPKDRQQKAEASRALTPATPSHSFWNIDSGSLRADWVKTTLEALTRFVDDDPKFEEKMALFIARQTRAIDDNLVGIVADRIREKIPLSYRYVTDSILKQHKDACLLIYEEDYTDTLIERGLIEVEPVEEVNVVEEKEVSVAELIKEVMEEDSDSSVPIPDPTIGINTHLAEEITI